MVGINQFLLDNRVGKSTSTVSGKLCINTTMLVIVNSGTMCLESRLCPAHPKEEAASSNSLRSCCISPGNMGGRHRLCALEKSREKKSFKSVKYLSEGWLINNYVWSTHCKSFLNLHRQFAIGSRWSLFLSKNIFFLVNYDIFTITFKKKTGLKTAISQSLIQIWCSQNDTTRTRSNNMTSSGQFSECCQRKWRDSVMEILRCVWDPKFINLSSRLNKFLLNKWQLYKDFLKCPDWIFWEIIDTILILQIKHFSKLSLHEIGQDLKRLLSVINKCNLVCKTFAQCAVCWI